MDIALVLARRLLRLLATLLGAASMMFLLMHLVPGDPARALLGTEATPDAVAALHHDLGLDRPVLVQFARYLGGLAHVSLGRSIFQHESVGGLIASRLPATLELAVAALALAVLLGGVIGVTAARRRGGWFDAAAGLFSQLGMSMTVFWLGLLLMNAFAIRLNWLPAIGRGPGLGDVVLALLQARAGPLGRALSHLALPCLTLALPAAAIICRLVRASMLEALQQDYIRTAIAKGVSRRRLIWNHAARNAMLPVVGFVGWQFGTMLAGSVLVENVFGWPGMGQLAVTAVSQRDLPLVEGITLTFAAIVCLINTGSNMLCELIDPRLRGA